MLIEHDNDVKERARQVVSGKTALIVSPHPDDMEIGMGGTATKMIASGTSVVSVVVTDGRRSTTLGGLSETELAELRGREARDAARLMGVEHLILMGLRDINTDTNAAAFREELGRIIAEHSPREVYSPHPQMDKHPTHRAVAKLLLERLSRVNHGPRAAPRVWFYEVWTPFPSYDRIEDITDYVEVKREAISAHQSQLEYKDYAEGILGLNSYRAVFDSTEGKTAMGWAEVFIKY